MNTDDDSNLNTYNLTGAVEASAAAVSAVLADARAFAEGAALGETVSYRFIIVVEELVANIVSHGDPPPGTTIDYRFEREAGRVRITMADSGIRFDPRHLPERPQITPATSQVEGGIGWPLILQWCRLEACSRHGDRNRLTLLLEAGR